MFPAIAEVVEELEAARTGLDQGIQAHSTFIDNRFRIRPVLIGYAVVPAAEDKLV
jgi:hypothetical protein